jgi:two-component system chemotaxis response regulator CheB
MLRALPEGLPASVLIVLHTTAAGSTHLPQVLNRAGPLPVAYARDGEALAPGRVYLAPPDHHLLICEDGLGVQHGARVNRARPAIDPLFRSAARWRGQRVVGVVVSGSLDDGAAGLAAIATAGGLAIVQDPRDAAFNGMPMAALAAVPSARVAPAAELGSLIADAVAEAVTSDGHRPLDSQLHLETVLEGGAHTVPRQPGEPSGVACPDCRGAMTQIELADTFHYRCHVGHAFSPATLLHAQSDSAEAALFTAMSILEEQAAVHAQLAERSDEALERSEHERRARRAQNAATDLRRHLHDQASAGPEPSRVDV